MESKKVQRVRSPNYPYYSLKDCVIFLEKLYKKYGMGEIHTEDAVTQMGHSPTSSTAGRVLASMLSFGLLESRGAKDNKFVRLTRLAQEILLGDDNPTQRYISLGQAAIKDSSMQEIWNKWGSNIPAEETIRRVLQLEMNYTQEGAKRFASVIAETYNFAKLSNVEEEEDNNTDEDEKEIKEQKTEAEKQIQSSVRKANLLLAGKNREITILAPADLTEIEFEMISKWLELQKYGLVNKESNT
jgi:hypothetical protein